MLLKLVIVSLLLSFVICDWNEFDHLGLDVFSLTPEELKLSQLAEKLSATTVESHHHRVKRGGYKKKKSKNSGYYALPLPPLPSNVNEEKVQLLTKPNRNLIHLANQIANRRYPNSIQDVLNQVNRRQDVLPPAVNNIPPPDEPPTLDPFILTPQVDSVGGYPNSIQDMLNSLHDKPPDDGHYPPPYTPPDTLKYPPFKQPQQEKPVKKKVVYKVVNTKAPKVEHGTTKKTIYKLADQKGYEKKILPQFFGYPKFFIFSGQLLINPRLFIIQENPFLKIIIMIIPYLLNPFQPLPRHHLEGIMRYLIPQNPNLKITWL